MKVVLFCGGQGMRIRDFSSDIPKPMVPLGYRPILWHLMKYYAHFGHKQFILCLGYQADVIKRFFLEYREEISNDFVLSHRNVDLLASDIDDWEITFVDTGVHTEIGERLRRVKDHLDGDDYFLANYADALVDLDHDSYVDTVVSKDVVAGLVAVRPPQSYHALNIEDGSWVTSVTPVSEADIWLNGGFFVLRQDIFDYIQRGDDLATETFARLMPERQLYAHKFEGFFGPMDTFKDKNRLDGLWERGEAPWVVWKDNNHGS